MEILMEAEKSYLLLKRYRIPYSEPKLAKNADSAARTAKKIGFPVAMKVVSKKIIHKSDAGGVMLNLSSEDEVAKAFDEIAKAAKQKAKAKIDGVLVQKMESGTEVIIGLKKDPQFGPVVLFGLGGIYVELMKDVSIRIAPLTKADCIEMIKELKGSAVLEGARGKKPVNTDEIVKILMAVSSIGMKNKKIIEMDLNPVIVDNKSAKVVDIRIIAEK
jgi:acetyl-CoA synthetase (ADP-forming)